MQVYANTGAVHVLAVSGMHTAILFVALQFLLKPLLRLRHLRWLVPLLILAGLWGYALLAGLPPSVNRAAFMCSLLLLATQINRRSQIYKPWQLPPSFAFVRTQLAEECRISASFGCAGIVVAGTQCRCGYAQPRGRLFLATHGCIDGSATAYLAPLVYTISSISYLFLAEQLARDPAGRYLW